MKEKFGEKIPRADLKTVAVTLAAAAVLVLCLSQYSSLAWVLCLVLCLVAAASTNIGQLLILVWVGAFLFVINVSKIPSSDLEWYVSFYDIIRQHGVGAVMGGEIMGIQARESESLFYGFLLITSKVHAGDKTLIVAVSAFIYGLAFLALMMMHQATAQRATNLHATICASLLLGLTATLVTQLIRQYFAISTLVLAVSCFAANRPRTAILAALVAPAFHNSAAVFSIGLLATYFAIGSHWLPRWVLPLILPAIGLSAISFASLSDEAVYITNDGAVSPTVLLADGLILLAMGSYVLRRFSSDLSRGDGGRLFLAYSLYAGAYLLALSLSYSPLLSLRFYFYIDAFRTVSLALFLPLLFVNRGWQLLLVVFGVLYVCARIWSSPFSYEESTLPYAVQGLLK